MESKVSQPPSIESATIKLFHGQLKMPLVQLPLTTSLISVPHGKVLLSPHPMLTTDEFQSMGEVTDIVAPNLYHHLGIQKAAAAHPQAKLWGVAGFEHKRKDIRWDSFLSASDWPHQADLVAIPLEGMPKINEFLFFHKASKTLFVTDLCFHIVDGAGFGGWLIYHIFDTYKRLAVSRLFIKSVSDKVSFQQSLATLFSYDFDHIVVCHGSVVKGAGRARLQHALSERGYVI
jgi:hypothetical protein